MRKRASFLTADEPKALLNVMRKRKVEALQVRRANALVALDDVFAAAVHPEYQSRPAHGWFIRSDKPAIKATTGRQRLNLHGALDLETMKLTLVEGEKINAETSLRLFEKLERAYPDTRVIPGDPG